ncbi:MAG TPA: sensor histidine kinase [Rhizomicrobium sp.]|jgi:two-component sensor histidine kinase|nr:sensor histidine kinase [Rhizomicrobium sp.]
MFIDAGNTSQRSNWPFEGFGLPASQPDLVETEPNEFLLLRETHHRFANTLTVLMSMLRQEFAPTPALRESISRCEARIAAFGNLHRCLVVGAADEWISAQGYIEHLCGALSDALLRPLGVRCEVVADEGEVPRGRCEQLGLIITELVTNAAKHAFRGRNDGLVRVELINRSDCWVCTVSDNGVGAGAASAGTGSKILEQLVRALGGNLIRKSGRFGTSITVACHIESNFGSQSPS